MKLFIIVISVISALYFHVYGCNDSKALEYKHSKADTVRTVAKWCWENDFIVHETKIFRITKDTLCYDTIGAGTLKQIWRRDTVYLLPVTDTARDKNGVVIRDTSGRAMFSTRNVEINQIIQDYDKSF